MGKGNDNQELSVNCMVRKFGDPFKYSELTYVKI